MPVKNSQEDKERQAAFIRARREALGLTRAQLAQELGLSHSYLTNIERGTYPLTKPETVARVARVLRTDPDEFYLALGRIPPDVADFMAAHPSTIKAIRKVMAAQTKEPPK